jgi:phage virion morphogenesis protein
MATTVTRTNSQDITALVGKLNNPRPLMDEVGRILVKAIQARITTTKVGPDGSAWAPWSPATLAARSRRGNVSRGLLYNSGNLERSIGYDNHDNRVVVGADANKAPYAAYLQEGTSRMPARPFVGISAADQSAIRSAVSKYLVKP